MVRIQSAKGLRIDSKLAAEPIWLALKIRISFDRYHDCVTLVENGRLRNHSLFGDTAAEY